MSDKLSYSIRKKRGIPILDLCGKIIGSWAFTLKEELIQLKDSGVSNVILNFQDVTSIDSLCIMAVIAALEAGLSVKIIHLSTTCKQILDNHNKHRGVLLNISEGGALIGYLDPITSEPYTFKYINMTMELALLGSITLEGKPVRFGRTSEMHIIGIELLSTEKSQNLVKQFYKDSSLSSNQSSVTYSNGD